MDVVDNRVLLEHTTLIVRILCRGYCGCCAEDIVDIV